MSLSLGLIYNWCAICWQISEKPYHFTIPIYLFDPHKIAELTVEEFLGLSQVVLEPGESWQSFVRKVCEKCGVEYDPMQNL